MVVLILNLLKKINLVKKIFVWITKNGAALFGLLNLIPKIVRELIVTSVRIIGIIVPDAFVEDVVIAKISKIFDKIEATIKSITDLLLKVAK